MEIRAIRELPDDFECLAREASAEGHNFLVKLAQEWASGKNRFQREREALFGLTNAEGKLIGVGGLNVDPYVDDPSIGRVRHVYISSAQRRKGLGKTLLNRIVRHAEGKFSLLRLRTQNPQAVEFYQSLGFALIANPEDKTHSYLEKPLA